ncbi:MAG: alpha/beta hydrolase, partial [Cytophagales bacterium]|nr:alpha/beta hydrolase [Cytophagales bacterium]
AVAPDIKKEFLRRINGNERTGEFLEKYILKRYGRTLEEFSAKYSAQNLKPIPTLLVYDKDDPDVPLYHGEELKKVLPHAELMITERLGHTRILRSEEVVQRVVSFLA